MVINTNTLLEANWVILYSVYGQVFFIMGLVTLLNWRRESRLELARALPWLAGFGIAHGLNEWGYIFIPLQASYLPPAIVNALVIAHLLLLAVSFFFLLQFGVQLMLPVFGRRRWVRFVPISVLLLWGGAVLLRATLCNEPLNVLIVIGDGWSRYLLCFPGAILAHLGLLRQARQVREMGFERIAIYLTGAAVAFSTYAIVGGLIVPTSPVFPATILNYDLLDRVVHLPAPIFRSVCGLAMAVFVARFLNVFQAETDRLIGEMEQAQILATDRERIGRELHDGIIQNMYAAGLSLEDAQHRIDQQPALAAQRIQSVMGILNQAILDIRRYIFDLQAAEQARELESVLEDLVNNIRLDTLLNVELEVSGQRCWNLGPEQVANLIQIAREALSNVVQHASAQQLAIQLHYAGDGVRLTVTDDGQGMPVDTQERSIYDGRGIGNMEERARLIGGTFSIESTPGEGVRLIATAPCNCASL